MSVFTKEMIAMAAKGNQFAIEDLYQETYTNVYHTVKALIADEDTVLDIVQNTYIKAFQSLDQLDAPENFRAWIKRIATNKAKDSLKKKKPILFSEMAAEDTEEIDFRDEQPDHLPEAVMDRKETTRLMNEILGTLSEDQRLVIGMFYYEEMSVREIAQTIGCSENTVKSRLNYGRKKVELQVRELEKKGTRLYTLAPLPFLLWLLRVYAQTAEIPSASILQTVLHRCAGASAAAAAGSAAGAKAAVAAGAKALTTKIVAGVLAVALVGGGAAIAIRSMGKAEGKAAPEPTTPAATAESTVSAAEETVPAATEEAEEVISPDSAYQQITNAYLEVIDMDSADFLTAPENYFCGDHAAVRYYHMYHDHSFHCAYYDIDGNGTDELLIGMDAGQEIVPVDVYGFDGAAAIELIDAPTLGDRSRLSLLEDGTLYLLGGSGAADTSHAYLTLSGTTLTDAAPSTAPLANIPWQYLGGKAPVTAASAYQTLLEDYRAACGFDHDEWLANPQVANDSYAHLSLDSLMTYHTFGMHKFFTAYHDIDGNGTDELFLGMGMDTTDAYAVAVYAFDGSRAVTVCDTLFEVLADGTILLTGNGGGIERITELGGDGFSLIDKAGTGISAGAMVFDQDFASQGGRLTLSWEPFCG